MPEDAEVGNPPGAGPDEGVVTMGKKIREMKDELLADDEFRREYDALEEEFSIAAQVPRVRSFSLTVLMDEM